MPRRAHGENANTWFFWFFEARGAAAIFFSLPALLAVVNRLDAFSPFELAAAGLRMVAFTGEVAADRQLERFKADAANGGRTCGLGPWRYSRHPNDFFEWSMWVLRGVRLWVAVGLDCLRLFSGDNRPAVEGDGGFQ